MCVCVYVYISSNEDCLSQADSILLWKGTTRLIKCL